MPCDTTKTLIGRPLQCKILKPTLKIFGITCTEPVYGNLRMSISILSEISIQSLYTECTLAMGLAALELYIIT